MTDRRIINYPPYINSKNPPAVLKPQRKKPAPFRAGFLLPSLFRPVQLECDDDEVLAVREILDSVALAAGDVPEAAADIIPNR